MRTTLLAIVGVLVLTALPHRASAQATSTDPAPLFLPVTTIAARVPQPPLRVRLYRGEAIPPDYHVERRYVRGEVAAGMGIGLSMYALTALETATGCGGDESGSCALGYVPLAGPFIVAANYRMTCSCICFNDTLVPALYYFLGAGQLIGGLVTLTGFSTHRSYRVPNAERVAVLPWSTNSGAGLMLAMRTR